MSAALLGTTPTTELGPTSITRIEVRNEPTMATDGVEARAVPSGWGNDSDEESLPNSVWDAMQSTNTAQIPRSDGLKMSMPTSEALPIETGGIVVTMD